ncbi:unnamed protein product [Laminaria digitata]
MTEKYFAELQKYQEDLADPSVREEINKELESRQFSSLAEYYDGKSELASYTLETELPRMSYSVVTEEGDRFGDEEEADRVREFLSGRKEHPMLRMANQSIFADMLEAVQGRLFRPDLEISVISRDCEFSLDFSNGTMEARSLFGVSTVGCGEPGARETLEIGQIKGVASVDTLNKVSSQRLFSPQLRMVFDDDMRASARVLANHSLMGGMRADDGVGAGGGRWQGRGVAGLQGMGSLRQSLALVGSGGMGRAAAAGTGLLESVVAGVGSAVGASRAAAGEPLGSSEGPNPRGQKGNDSNDAPLQLYRKNEGTSPPTGSSQEISATAPTREAFPRPVGTGDWTAPSGQARTADVSLDEHSGGARRSATDSAGGGGDRSGAAMATAFLGGGQDREDGRHGRAPEGGGGGDGDCANIGFSALGMASATGGAVLRGLWGGLQGVQSASLTRQGSGGASGGGEPPAIRLYRREGDVDDER